MWCSFFFFLTNMWRRRGVAVECCDVVLRGVAWTGEVLCVFDVPGSNVVYILSCGLVWWG